uniref:hypothetical protein n=1 Tax=Acetivibrio cellulolyticus TaxID=35830 RepID=UPI0002481BE7|nr:hypothetical protein [Acetivibrio cellulolyticus]
MNNSVLLGIGLILLSLTFYGIQFLVFNDSKTTVFYFFQDIAFVPINVFLVSVVLDQIISKREKQEKLRKINIVISAFFNEIGTPLIKLLAQYNLNFHDLKAKICIKSDCIGEDFDRTLKIVESFEFDVDSRIMDLTVLKEFMHTHKSYILGMFENPNLLEHDAFTDMLWAVFHVLDELDSRESLYGLPGNDMEHLSNDIKRALKLVITEWVYYMKHLKAEYPYLFALAVRKNPFLENIDNEQ